MHDVFKECGGGRTGDDDLPRGIVGHIAGDACIIAKGHHAQIGHSGVGVQCAVTADETSGVVRESLRELDGAAQDFDLAAVGVACSGQQEPFS